MITTRHGIPLLATLALAACSGGTQTVSGTLDTASFPEAPETVTATTTNGSSVSATVDAGGRFSLELAPLTSYRLDFAEGGSVVYPTDSGSFGSRLNTGMPGAEHDFGTISYVGAPEGDEDKGWDADGFCTWVVDLRADACADDEAWTRYWAADADNEPADDWSMYERGEVCDDWLSGKEEWCQSIDEAAVPQNKPGACVGDCKSCADGTKVEKAERWYYCKEGTWYDVTDWDKDYECTEGEEVEKEGVVYRCEDDKWTRLGGS